MIKHPHPVDMLAELQAKRRLLAAEENRLRRRLLASGTANLVGDHYQASISVFERAELDKTALEQRFGQQAVAACVRIVEHKVLSLSRRRRSHQKNGSASVVDMSP